MFKYKVLSNIGLITAPVFLCTLPVKAQRPNILFCVADDQSYPHTSAYGCKWVKTPNFDSIAKAGILFTNAYTPIAKSAPSRSCMLTGRNPWQLEEAANHGPFFPDRYKTYAECLGENGYYVGYTGKGWAPGNPGNVMGERRELLGKPYNEKKLSPPAKFISNIDYASNFEDFLKNNSKNQPFCFWFGSSEPHRPYDFGVGNRLGGKATVDIDKVYDFWPDNDTIRNDILDYAYEIEYFDKNVGRMIEVLKKHGLLENTIIIVTSDNGMPFPRVKGNAFELANHLPLAIMWPKGIKHPGREFTDFTSFTDFAPTLLDIAEVDFKKSGMNEFEGKSLRPVFNTELKGEFRKFMILGKERSDLGRPGDAGYPIRGIVMGDFLYLKNYYPERWPAGNPETGYMDCDGSPTKTYILNQRRQKRNSRYWDLCFGKFPAEELYKLDSSPECIINLANESNYLPTKVSLIRLMEQKLLEDKDPRIIGNGAIFDKYPYYEGKLRDFYDRVFKGESLRAGWINDSDIEKF